MPLIEKQKKETLTPVTVRLEEGLANRLKEYASYLESSRDYVVGEALRYIMNRDKDFVEHEKSSSAAPDRKANSKKVGAAAV